MTLYYYEAYIITSEWTHSKGTRDSRKFICGSTRREDCERMLGKRRGEIVTLSWDHAHYGK